MNVNVLLLSLSKKFAGIVKKEFKDNLVSIVLFGSVARKEAGPHSDIDLLLVLKKLPNGRLARSKLLEHIEDKLEKDLQRLRAKKIHTNFNFLLKTPEEAAITRLLYLDMTQEAVYLYDRADFFKNVINNFKKRLKQLGSVRKKSGSVRYWDIKPDYTVGEVFEI